MTENRFENQRVKKSYIGEHKGFTQRTRRAIQSILCELCAFFEYFVVKFIFEFLEMLIAIAAGSF